MKWSKKILSLGLAAAIAAAGCGNGDAKDSVKGVGRSAEDPKWAEAITTPYGKYPEEVKITYGKIAANMEPLKGTEYEGDTPVNNAWTRYLKEKANLVFEPVFEANDGEDYNQKVSMAIVNGELPDIMLVSDHQTLQQLYENDLIADLTEVYENCASDRIKDIYDSYGGRCLDSAKFDGKLMAFPTTEISHGPGVLWLRKDWMDKLGLKEPKTIDDIEHILKEFLDKDPGNNGKGKTQGLVMSPNVAGTSGGAYMVNNIFTLYGAYPRQWIDDGKGNAVYGSIQPEMKEGLGKLADWYQKGLIDRQLATRTGDDCKALLTSGKSGAVMDNWWGSWTVADTMKLDPKAEWQPYICPVNEAGEVTVFSGNPNSSYAVVSKSCENPQAIAKILNYQYDYSRYQDKDPESRKELDDYEAHMVEASVLWMNIDYYNAFSSNGLMYKEALDTGDDSRVKENLKNVLAYESYKTYQVAVDKGEKPDTYQWAGYESSVICADLAANARIKEINPIFFGTTKSMGLKWPTLEKMEQEMYLKIITGEKGLDYFDSFAKDWVATGGGQITEEVNLALKEKE